MIDAAVQTAIVAELRPCGLAADDISIRFDDELQSTVVTVRRSVKVDASKFICIRQALWAKAEVGFEDAQLGELYHAFDAELGRAEGRAIARTWLNQRGMLSRLPTFSDGEPAASVVAKVEQFCGIKAGTALEERGPGLVSIKPDFSTISSQPGAECLLYAIAAIDTEKLGFQFGFIGNEAVVEENKK